MKNRSNPSSPAPVVRLRPLAAVLMGIAFLLPLARAQWQAATYTLRGGWNAIYLHGDVNHATLDDLLKNNPEIVSVWRWNPNPNQVQFGSSPLIPLVGTPEWSIWRRGATNNTLGSLPGQTAYLVECTGAATSTSSLALTQKISPPRSVWVRNGANLLGFPSRLNGSTYPTFSAYFATFPAAIAANTKVYKYAGGPMGAANPVQVFSPAQEPLDRLQAYWFEASVVGNFYSPLEVIPSPLEGLVYGRTGSLLTVTLRNRTAAAVNVTITPTDSAAAPTGQEQVSAAVPLTYRSFNATTNAFDFNPVSGAFVIAVGPQTSIELSFGVDRSKITGATDALYASLLRFTDGGNLMDVLLPVSARVTGLAGLWIGDVSVTNVQSNAPGNSGTTTVRPYLLRVLLHRDNDGKARLLSHVFLGKLAPAPHAIGLCVREAGLKADEKATAMRLVAAHLPPDTVVGTGSGELALGSTLVRTVSIPHNAPSNPFVHTYHPDHDNRNARFDGALSAGLESPMISRECSFTFTATPPAGSSAVGWGSTVLGGAYSEKLTGLHKTPLIVTGTFELRRVSELGGITVP